MDSKDMSIEEVKEEVEGIEQRLQPTLDGFDDDPETVAECAFDLLSICKSLLIKLESI